MLTFSSCNLSFSACIDSTEIQYHLLKSEQKLAQLKSQPKANAEFIEKRKLEKAVEVKAIEEAREKQMLEKADKEVQAKAKYEVTFRKRATLKLEKEEKKKAAKKTQSEERIAQSYIDIELKRRKSQVDNRRRLDE